MPKMSKSVVTAGFILLAFLSYFVLRSVLRAAPEAEPTADSETAAKQEAPPEVVVFTARSQQHLVYASLKGRTEPDRTVTVKSETTGTVTIASIREGRDVQRGAVLCGLGIESRAARVAEAQAAVTANRLDYESAATLAEKGWTTSNRAAAMKATLDRSEASLAAAEIELGKTKLRAPFSGVFETRLAETGDFLAPGSPCGVLVDLDPIIISVEVTEDQMSAITLGSPANITLNNGTEFTGSVRYVARTSDQATRTFRLEIEAENADNSVSAGLTASVRVALGDVQATLITPASLVLHDDGRVGIRYIGQSDVVQFSEIHVIDDAASGVWVTGIPDEAQVLSAGQDYYREGIVVTPLPEEAL